MDAEQGVAAQDLHMAGYVVEATKGMIVAVNKWDLMEDTEEARDRLRKASVAAPAVHSMGAARVRFGEGGAERGGAAGAGGRNRGDAVDADTDSGGQFGAARGGGGEPAAFARPAADADQVRHAGFDSARRRSCSSLTTRACYTSPIGATLRTFCANGSGSRERR